MLAAYQTVLGARLSQSDPCAVTGPHLQRGGGGKSQPEAGDAQAWRQKYRQRQAARPVHQRVAGRRQQLAPGATHDACGSSMPYEVHGTDVTQQTTHFAALSYMQGRLYCIS